VALVDGTLAYVAARQLRDDDRPGLLEFAQAWRDHCGAEQIALFIDSLHSWAQLRPESYSEYENLNAGLAELHVIAAALSCPVVVIAERNRPNITAGGLNSGAGTRRIEYGAEVVLDLDRKSEARPDARDELPVTVKVHKNRHGAPGATVELRFHGSHQSFREL
jgi:SpoVK/Ycf46/Vps4 family AAA+-type ATPase